MVHQVFEEDGQMIPFENFSEHDNVRIELHDERRIAVGALEALQTKYGKWLDRISLTDWRAKGFDARRAREIEEVRNILVYGLSEMLQIAEPLQDRITTLLPGVSPPALFERGDIWRTFTDCEYVEEAFKNGIAKLTDLIQLKRMPKQSQFVN
jgi:hypothetical protein